MLSDIQFSRDAKSFVQPAISFKLSAHNCEAQEMLAAALEFGRELCTCSPDVLGSL
jgi:hypothetical protein